MKFINDYKNLKCKDVIQCVFNLNKLDLQIYSTLKQIGESRADDLAKIMEKERSTIYRSLQKLKSCGLCIKKTKTIDSGGYYHIYSCNKKTKIQKELELCIDKWYKNMRETLKNFEKEID